MEQLFRDVRLASRRLGRAPGFTLFAVASLALGIGVSTAVYSAVRTLLWMPLGIPDPQQLIAIRNSRFYPAMSWQDFEDLQRQQTTLTGVAASMSIRSAFSAPGVSEAVFGEAVSADYFGILGLRPRAGRLLDAIDERNGSRHLVVSEQFWWTRLHADPGVIGRVVKLGGQSFEIVGVTAGTFHGLDPFLPETIWIPASAARQAAPTFGLDRGFLDRREVPSCSVWARLKPGVDAARASNEAMLIGRQLDAVYPARDSRRRDWSANANGAGWRELKESINTIGVMILMGVAVLLLIACTNLANLSLARGSARSQETAVRSALGASRWRLVREQLVESGIVVGCGGALGVALLLKASEYLSVDLPIGRGVIIPFTPHIDASVLGASFGVMTLAVGVFGLWPALQSSRANVRDSLGAGAGATPPKWRLHRNLVAWQVCGSVSLLLVALMSARVVSLGVPQPSDGPYQNLAVAQIDFALNGKDEAEGRRLVGNILGALRADPTIERAMASNGLPFGFFGFRDSVVVTIPGEPLEGRRATTRLTFIIAATPDLFSTLNVRIVRGRPFSELDGVASPRVAVVSEELARQAFHTTDVVGRTLLVGRAMPTAGRSSGPQPISIVGVSADVRPATLSARPDQLIFVPLEQRYDARLPLIVSVRTRDPSAGVAILRSTIRQVDPDLALSSAGTGSVLVAGPLFLLRVIAALAATLGALALIMAMAGLFGVLSHVIIRRTREIGIRLAIGAERADVFRLVLREGLRPVVKGLVLGLGIGFVCRLLVRGALVRGVIFTTVTTTDPLELTLIPAVFLLAAVLACYLPAARASRVDPNVALRDL